MSDRLDRLAAAIAAKLADQLASKPAPRYLTVAAAAEYVCLSQDSIRAMLDARRLTPLRPVAGRIVIDRRELDAVIQSSTRRPRTGRGIRQAMAGPE
jgi:hypothetical protein